MSGSIRVTYKHIWKISGPIILGLVAQNLLNVIDTIFLGRVGEVALGAGAIGGLFYLAVVMLGIGFGTGTQILIGRRNGEKNFASFDVREVLRADEGNHEAYNGGG